MHMHVHKHTHAHAHSDSASSRTDNRQALGEAVQLSEVVARLQHLDPFKLWVCSRQLWVCMDVRCVCCVVVYACLH